MNNKDKKICPFTGDCHHGWNAESHLSLKFDDGSAYFVVTIVIVTTNFKHTFANT